MRLCGGFCRLDQLCRPEERPEPDRVPRERVDLYFDDGSMISLTDGSPDAAQLLPLARRILGEARATQ